MKTYDIDLVGMRAALEAADPNDTAKLSVANALKLLDIIEFVQGYQADLVVIRKALDEVNAPHDCEDGVSLEPLRIQLLGQERDAARARIAELEAGKGALVAQLQAERRDVDQLRERIAQLEAQLAESWTEHAMQLQIKATERERNARIQIAEERDQLRAQLAAANSAQLDAQELAVRLAKRDEERFTGCECGNKHERGQCAEGPCRTAPCDWCRVLSGAGEEGSNG